MVEVPNYSGPLFITEKPKVISIFPVERKIECWCKRKQIPLRLGWATTIHRCQGMTIGEGEVNRYINKSFSISKSRSSFYGRF